MSKFQLVPINDIRVVNEENHRKQWNNERFEELKESIKNQGLLQPIMVTAKPAAENDGKNFKLSFGYRRLRAIRELGGRKVPALVIDGTSATDVDIAMAGLSENFQRDNPPPIDEAAALKDILDKTGWTQDRLAKHIGKTGAYISYRLSLLNLPEDLQSRVNRGDIKVSHAVELARVAKDTDPKQLDKLASKAGGMSIDKFRTQVQEELNIQRQERKPKKAAIESAPAAAAAVAAPSETPEEVPELQSRARILSARLELEDLRDDLLAREGDPEVVSAMINTLSWVLRQSRLDYIGAEK